MRFLRSTHQLHLVINHKGSIVAVKITPGNVDERTVLDEMTSHLKGKLFADKGYISQNLFQTLYQRGLKIDLRDFIVGPR